MSTRKNGVGGVALERLARKSESECHEWDAYSRVSVGFRVFWLIVVGPGAETRAATGGHALSEAISRVLTGLSDEMLLMEASGIRLSREIGSR